MKSKTIRTERLTLVPISMEYLDAVHEYASDAENTRLMMFLPNDSIEETREFVRQCEEQWSRPVPDYYEYIILYGGEPVGSVNLYPEEDGTTAELGWLIMPRFHRRGYAYEAAKGLIDYGASRLGIRRFIAHCDTENAASYSLMEKLGMTRADEYGGRFNKGSDEERREYLYEMTVDV